MMVEVICEKCGGRFGVSDKRKDTARHCSHKCRRNRTDVACKTCGKEFWLKASHAREDNFCSKACMYAGLRARRQSEIEQEFGEPIKDLLERLYYDHELGIKAIAKTIGVSDRNLWDWFEELGIERRDRSTAVELQWKDNPQRREGQSNRVKQDFKEGRRDPGLLVKIAKTPWARKRNSESKKGEKNPMYNLIGPLSPFWRGGKVTYRGKGWRSIRKQIIRRDGKKCRRCGSKKDLQVHHITPYRETQDNSPENLVTLCSPCHIKVEHHNATWG